MYCRNPVNTHVGDERNLETKIHTALALSVPISLPQWKYVSDETSNAVEIVHANVTRVGSFYINVIRHVVLQFVKCVKS